MFELLLDAFGSIALGVIRGLVGVLYPPKSATWARRQRQAIFCALIAVALLALSIVIGRGGWTPLVWFLFGMACVFAGVFIFVGDACRSFHEAAAKRASSGDTVSGSAGE